MALFVARLPFEFTSGDLAKIVDKYGEVTRCDVPPRKGFGFVNFKNKDDAERCIRELDGTTLDFGRIAVEWAKGGGDRGARGGPTGRGCFKCGKEGHFARECPEGGYGGAPPMMSSGPYGGRGGYEESGSSGRGYDDRERSSSSRRYEDSGSGSRGYDDRDRERSSRSSYGDERREERGGSSSGGRAYDDRDRGHSSRDRSRSRSPARGDRADSHRSRSRSRSHSRS
eukprot:m51a1_g4761 putative rna-binding region rnp-1 domain-containing protein (227) ;mRNA; r:436708-437737